MVHLSRKLFSSFKSRRRNATSVDSTPPAALPPPGAVSGPVSEDASSLEAASRTALSHPVSATSASLVHHSRPPDGEALDRASDPLGLSVIHNPSKTHSADVIFIHGLGGSSRVTWSKHRRPDLFWPAEWLPKDEDLERTRIFTFGYNAQFKSSSQSSAVGIADFSKNLLFDMLFGRDVQGRTLDLGNVPIIFVAHSMGGLVFKKEAMKAFLDAQLDSRYKKIMISVKAAIFLATPHRGSDLAPYLNRLLSISVGSNSKQYVADLIGEGPFLRAVNDQFRHVAAGLQIFSFYETLKSSVGISSVLILDPETSKLGYPGEISRPLNTDHYSACKFESPQDPSYKAILEALKSVVTSSSGEVVKTTRQEMEQLNKMLLVPDTFEHDFNYFCSQRAESTCQWILDEEPVCEWLSSKSASGILRVDGRPGRGKSVVAAFLIQHLQQRSIDVQYFFFRAGDASKRTMAALIKALAFQIAQVLPAFRRALIELAGTGYQPKDINWRATWKKIFPDILLEMDYSTPLYWIIDGLDEAQSPHHIFDLLADIHKTKIPIKVLVMSRWTPSISSSFDRIREKVPTSLFSLDHNLTDIDIYVKDELKYNNWSDEVRETVITKILSQSNHSFLWVRLILSELMDCDTEEDIQECLAELPSGLDGLYRRMEETIAAIRRPSDTKLAHQLLQWAVYSQRPIQIEELLHILEPEFGRFLDISQTANRLCGHFITIEADKRFNLIHQTAREYLTSASSTLFSLKSGPSHATLLKRCMWTFTNQDVRFELQQVSPSRFEYRATSWPHHLEASEAIDNEDGDLHMLGHFFSQTSALVWIQILASLGQLNILVHASQALSSFVRRLIDNSIGDSCSRRSESLKSLEVWSCDLLKILGKFGDSLSQRPELIFTGVAPLCPTNSAVYKFFGQKESNLLVVKGLSEDWDDCLTRVSTGGGAVCTLICCSAKYLAVGNNEGLTVIWDTTTFFQVCAIEHGETVSMFCFGTKGGLLATYGHRTTKIWDPSTGRLIQSFANNSDIQAKSIKFVEKDTALLVSSGHHCIIRASLLGEGPWAWHVLGDGLMISNDTLEGTYRNSPTLMAISPDGTKVGIAYRRYPLSIWSINPTRLLRRVTAPIVPGQPQSDLFVSHMSWHPGGAEILGLFQNGYSFKLNLVDGSYQEQPPTPGQVSSSIICSPDGLVYAICGVGGTVNLFDYKTQALIYQLTSQAFVQAFSFSDNGRRFCDIRNGSCTVWEPDSLVNLARVDGCPDDSQDTKNNEKQRQPAFELFVEKGAPTSLMSPMPRDSVVCLGDEDGAVELFDYDSSERIKIGQTVTGMGVSNLAWSDDGNYLCYAELRRRLSIVQVEKNPSGFQYRKVEMFKVQGVTQLLFLPETKFLLVATLSSVQLLSLDPNKLNIDLKFESSKKARKWIVHPQSKDHLISLTSDTIHLHTQVDIQELRTWHWDDTANRRFEETDNNNAATTIAEMNEEIEDVYSTFYQDHIMVKVAQKMRSRKLQTRLIILDAASIDTKENSSHTILPQVGIPAEVSEMIEVALNVLPNGKLVFIDHSSWVCSWKLGSARGIEDVERHFFIPRDWLPVKGQDLLQLTASGAIICARKGGVSVINNSTGLSW